MLKILLVFGFCAYGMNSAGIKSIVKEPMISIQPVEEKRETGLQNLLFSKKKIQLEKSLEERLIEKLEYLKRTLPKNHKARNALNLRLAHSLSLRAEDNFLKSRKRTL